jgi:hypothetical protein
MPQRIATTVACSVFLVVASGAPGPGQAQQADIFDRVKHGYATSEAA